MQVRKSIFALIAASGLLVSGACNAQSSDAAGNIPLDLTGPRPTAQLTIGESARVTAIFDSGAAASVLKIDYARRLGLPEQGQAAAHGPSGAPVQGFRTTLRNAALGEVRFNGAMAVALDIPLPLEGVDAIISPEVFEGRLVRFEFANSVARILPLNAENTPDSRAEPYIGADSRAHRGRTPGVRVSLPGGAEIDAILDTGSARGLSLPHTMAATLALAEPLTPDEPQRLVGAEYPAFRARLSGEVRIGALRLQNPEVRFIDGPTPPIVGMQILRNATIVLDPRGERSWVLAPQ